MRLQRWTLIAALTAVLACAGCANAADNPSPNIPCALPGEDTQTYSSVDAMAPQIRQELARRFGDPSGQHVDMAARNEEFNVTDSVTDLTLSFRRFIQGGRSGTRWYVWYEYGGIAYGIDAAIFDLPAGTAAPQLVIFTWVPDERPCELSLQHWRDTPHATRYTLW